MKIDKLQLKKDGYLNIEIDSNLDLVAEINRLKKQIIPNKTDSQDVVQPT